MTRTVDYPALFTAVYHELMPLVGATNAFNHAHGAVDTLVRHRHVVGSGRRKPRPRQDAVTALSEFFHHDTTVPNAYVTADHVVGRLQQLGLTHLNDTR